MLIGRDLEGESVKGEWVSGHDGGTARRSEWRSGTWTG
jgi:hypothetical protein